MNQKNFVDLESNRITLAFEPDPDRIKAMRLIAGRHGGAQIATHGGVWRCTLPLAAKDDIATHFTIVPWSDAFRALTRGAGAKFQTSEDAIASRFLAAAGDLSAPLQDGRTLYEHQRTGIEFLLRTPRSILADDMGCGKTTQAMIASWAIYETTRAQTVVITKACLIHDWRKEAEKLNHRVVSVYSWAKIPKPTPGTHYTLIADEAHLASLSSQRGKAFQEWAAAADFVFLLTGTPMINGRHINILPLLKAIKHPLAEDQREYEAKFCGAKRVVLGAFKIDDTNFRISWTCKSCRHHNDQKWNYRWKSYTCGCGRKEDAPRTFKDTKGATNAAELKAAIATFLLRRLKSECLDLPTKTRIQRKVEVTPDMHAIYTAAVQSAKAKYKERVKSGEVASEGEALALLAAIRVAASKAKAAAAIELAEECVAEGSQALIFTEFLDSANQIAKHFKIDPYTGDTRRDIKVRIVEEFQRGERKVFAGTREAGGTGLTLTAANVVISVDRPMRPGDIDQAEDRAHRIGTKWPVTVYWLSAFPVCDKIDGFLATKQKAIDALLGHGKDAESGEQISARQVLLSLF